MNSESASDLDARSLTAKGAPGVQVTGGSLPSLGRRGEGWVVLQGVLIAALVAVGLKGPRWPSRGRRLRQGAALPLATAGACMMAAGMGGLGRHLTPFPRPVAGSELKRTGVYGLVRHPIYGAVLLLALAWTLVSSPATILPSAAGAAFLEAKRRREEAWLAEQHADYGEYCQAVPRRFIPWVW